MRKSTFLLCLMRDYCLKVSMIMQMKRSLFLILFTVFVLGIRAQDTRYSGTWIWHDEMTFGEDNEPRVQSSWDHFIRIDIDGDLVFVRLKLVGKNVDGRDFQTRREGENVVLNSDGSISFDEYLSKKEYDKDDHLYWTIWTHYIVKYEGGRLKVSEKTMGVGCNSSGSIIKDERNVSTTKYKTYYNEKDNW